MYLIEKTGRKRKICRQCRQLHGTRDCPRGSVTEEQRQAAIAHADRVWRELMADRSRDQFMDFVRVAKQMNEERYAAKA